MVRSYILSTSVYYLSKILTRYYKNFERLIEKKYYVSSYFTAERRLSSIPRFPAPPEKEPTFSEQQSDGCMREILGTSGNLQ